MNQEQVERLKDIMLRFGEIHTALSKTSLPSNEYNPISGLFATAKIDLYKLLTDIEMTINSHEVSKVKCDLCGKEWVAVRPGGLAKLECPNCGNITHFENIGNT